MKSFKIRAKKIIAIVLVTLVAVGVLVVAFISPVSKYLIEKYSVKYTGRQIKMDWLYLNPFTGYVHFNNLKIYEANNSNIFFSVGDLSVSVAMRRILHEEYEITSISLDKPYGIVVIKDKHNFNFSDIVEKFKSPTHVSRPVSSPVHVSILNVSITNGTFYLRDTMVGINYFIKNFNFKSPGMNFDDGDFKSDVSFDPGIGPGHIKGKYEMNVRTLDYNYSLNIQKLNLAIIEQYLKSIANYGTFSASLDADLKAKGNYKDAEDVDTKGRIAVNNFHFGKNRSEDYVSFDTLILAINDMDPKKHLYNLDSLKLTHPYFKFEKYDHLDNVETMFGQKVANVKAANSNQQQFNLVIALAHYIVNVSRNFFESAYKINKLAVERADLRFNDYSLNDEFSIEADPLYLRVDSIDKNKGLVNVLLTSDIKPYGNFSVTASINPRDSGNFVLNYHFEKVPLSLFNPYLISYTSFPLDRGTIELNGKWKVENGFIESENHILMIDPFIANRIRNKGARWIPMWLVMAFARDNGDVIDYQIPITGNLKSPTFHLNDVFFSILTNIFVKPPTIPYRAKVRKLENKIENSLTLKWKMRQSQMSASQKRFTEMVADFLAKDPEASIEIYPQQYEEKEKEYILLYEAKKKYYLSEHPEAIKSFTEKDSEYIDRMSVKDSLFIHYLDKHVKHRLSFTVQDKCNSIVDSAFVTAKFKQLNKARREIFMSYFKSKGVSDRVVFSTPKNYIPYNGFSFYKLEYKGAYPAYVVRAYKKMNELNHEAPREKYVKDRAKIGSI